MGGQEIGPGGWMFLVGISALADFAQIMLGFIGLGMSSASQTANIIPILGTAVALGLSASFMGLAILGSCLIAIVVFIILSLGFSHFGAGFFGERRLLRQLLTFIAELAPIFGWLPIRTTVTLVEIPLHNHHVRKEAEKMKLKLKEEV